MLPASALAGAGVGLGLSVLGKHKSTPGGTVFRTAGYSALFFAIARKNFLIGAAGAGGLFLAGAFDFDSSGRRR